MIQPSVYVYVGVDPPNKLPAHAWPGGYPIIYVCEDGGTLCPDCANGENGSLAADEDADDSGWTVAGAQVHWEGPPATCDHCNKQIESAYGDPDNDDS